MHERFCKAFGFVKAQQEHAAEYLQDGQGVQGRKRQKRSIGGEGSIGNNCVAVGVEVGAIGAEGLKRNGTAGADVFSVQQRLKGFQYGGVGGLRQQCQQCAFALEQAAQHSRDGKGPVATRGCNRIFIERTVTACPYFFKMGTVPRSVLSDRVSSGRCGEVF